MFKSIRWKFTTIYFLLIFIAMLFVGIFIINKFESMQLDQVNKNMDGYVDRLMNVSKEIKDRRLEDINENSFNNWPLPIGYRIYIIENNDYPKVVGTIPWNDSYTGKSAFGFDGIYSAYVIEAMNNEVSRGIRVIGQEDQVRENHLVTPIMDKRDDKVVGMIYVASELNDLDSMLNQSKGIFVQATLMALVVTIFLGFFIAKSVTVPINDVTVKARQMAKGNFDQRVEVKSEDEIGQLAMMFNTLTDKLKVTLAEIYREQSKMDTIFNNMADGVIACDIYGNIIHANPIAVDLLNLDYDTMTDMKYDKIISILSPNLTLEHIINEDKWRGDELVTTNELSYSVKYAPFRNDNEEIGGIIAVLQDVTEQQKLESMRREFVANVSHELKTPITTIKSYTETIMDGVIDEKEMALNFLGIVNGECDRMTRIVRDLLQLSNMDYKHTKWKFKELEVGELVNTSIMKLQMAAKDKEQTIDYDIDKEQLIAYADKDGLEQVVLNILSNAIKYTPKGGLIEVKAYKEKEDINIIIKDNGLGIPKEDLKRIFERFYRVDKARSREMGGTGLGLSIAKQIIQAHKGTIDIESEYNKGTQVMIRLPLKK